jgi:hypothetical protein
MANIGFNTEPYYDDFSEDKKFYRVLYRPGYAVQARELNQMQSILQNQISRFGSHIFKEGSMVIPGASSIDTSVEYVKLESTYGGVLSDSLLASFVGQSISNVDGLNAQVIWYAQSTSTDPGVLFVRYNNSTTTGSGDAQASTRVFTEGDILSNFGFTLQVQVAASNATGKGSVASIQRGVYFIKNNFVLVQDQTIVLDKFSNTPSYRIGLVATENEVTAEEDNSLFDNAQASFNYAAPGANRYSIDLTLTALPALDSAITYTTKTAYKAGQLVKNGNYYYSVTTGGISAISTAPTHTSGTVLSGTVAFKYIQTYDPAADTTSDTDFIELIRTFGGQTQKHVTTTAYSILEQTLARRTFDESGNYTVRPFNIDVREHRSNNRGQFATGTSYLIGDVVTNGGNTYVAKNAGVAGSTLPVHTVGTVTDGTVSWEYNTQPFYNRGVYTPELGGDESLLAIGLEPGKAYVQGYEIEKISTEFIDVPKARDYASVANDVISTTMGNYVVVQNVNNMPDIAHFGLINLYSYANASVGVAPSGLIGTARVRGLQYDAGSGGGAIGTQTAHYKLFLFDVKLNTTAPFAEVVKSFWAQGESNDANLNFSADIVPILELQRGSVTSYTSNTYGTQGSGVYLQGVGTNFTNDLQVGDYIQVGGTNVRIVSIDGTYTTTRIVVDTAVNVVGVQYSEVLTSLLETQLAPLVFPLPNYAIKDISDIEYTSMQYNIIQMGGLNSESTGYASQTWTISGASFASTANPLNYIVIDDDATAGGVVINATLSGGGTQTLKIVVPNTYAGRYIKVLAAVTKNSSSALTQRTKELKTATGATGATPALFGSTLDLNTQAVATSSSITLGKADGYKLISVRMAPTKAFNATCAYTDYTLDITDRYDFDDGQRPTHYDLARISLKPSYAPPTAPILVEFQYFIHGPGDFFTVKSYPYPTFIDYKAIPLYNGQPLRDYIDFRPRINDDGVTFGGTAFAASNVNLLPMRGADLVCDYSYYLARKSKIALDFGGKFFSINGVSSLKPGDAEDPALGMVLYNLSLEPYTFSTTQNSVSVTKIDNKRYTMRDIGKLEKRIDNLEYYTSLSLLEQQTESLKVTDTSGNDRYKNGFFVDAFNGHDSGDTTNQDYLCSIDMERAELRPFYTMQNINMVEKLVDDISRNGAGYKLYGDVITLPVLSTPPLITQGYASRLENINPFAVFTFIGDVKLNPSSDDWFETDRRPDVIVNVEGNYNTIKNLAEKAGVLGTVWNAWQTQWTGQPYSTGVQTYVGDKRGLGVVGWRDGTTSSTDAATLDQMFGNGPANSGWAHRVVQAETLAVNIGQSRTGVTSSIVTTIDKQVVADRVLSTAAIPYIRSRNILIQTQKLKPTTRFYPFFDGVDISNFCTPATKIVYTQPSGYSGEFDAFVNVGANSTMTARQVNGDTQVCLTRGDVIYVSQRSTNSYTVDTSPATAVVVGSSYNYNTGEYSLDVVNVKGSGAFTANDKLTGTNSGATCKVSATPTVAVLGDNLVTNVNGELNLLFNIPNTDSIRFRTGTRELKLVDTVAVDGDFSSRARANYTATGVLETKQQTVNAVRNALIAEEPAYANQVIVGDAGSRVVSDTGWYDPLAQTFLVQSPGGAFLSGVDIFFATKDPNFPVTIEIREVVNGFPGKRVLPFSRKSIKPAQVNAPIAGTAIDTNVFNTVKLNDVTVAKYDAPTRFNFDSPVYVQDNTEYAIVLSSDSNNYKVWISQLGDTIPGSSRTISEQPYAGVLFKSQNASTWTADQTQDLKFTIYRCQFDTQALSDVQFINDNVPLQTLDVDPFEVRSGVTTVRVWQKDHGLTTTSTVTISGVASAVAGIPASELNGKHSIANIDLDSYTITVTTTPTSTTYGGGTGVKATRNVQFDIAQPSVQVQSFSETSVDYSLKTITGQSVDSLSQSAYTQDVNPSGILINESNYFSSPRMVASSVNEADLIATTDKKSLTMHVAMSTTNDRLSPILDTHRTSFIAISNKVNSPTETNMNVPNLDYTPVVSANTTIAWSGSTITSADSTTKAKLAALTVGKYLTISGNTAHSSTNNGTFLINAVAIDGSSVTLTGASFVTEAASVATTIVQREMFVAEISPHGGSTYSAYVTKKVNLANPSSYLRVMFSINLPKEASIEVYYKANPAGAATGYDQITHTLMTPDTAIPNYTNSDNKFVDVTYSLTNMPTYDAVLVKLVMKSTNSSAIPRIKDLRVISCA